MTPIFISFFVLKSENAQFATESINISYLETDKVYEWKPV